LAFAFTAAAPLLAIRFCSDFREFRDLGGSVDADLAARRHRLNFGCRVAVDLAALLMVSRNPRFFR
jgi:hypothetical protein